MSGTYYDLLMSDYPHFVSRDYIDTLNYIESSRQDIRTALEYRDGPDCFYCGRDLDLENRTIDHVVSQREGRRRGWELESIHGISNLVLACKKCNAKKGDRMLDENGTIPPRPESRKQRRLAKAARKDVCGTCRSGRLLLIGQECPDCGSGPQPERWPTAYKRSPKECQHGVNGEHCWMCVVVSPELRVLTDDGLSV